MSAYPYPAAAPPQPRGAADPTAVMGRRTGAWVVDVLIYALIMAFLGPTPLSPLAEYYDVENVDDACEILQEGDQYDAATCVVINDRAYVTSGADVAVQTVVGLALFVGYCLLQGATGRTPGKALFGVKVVDEQGRTPGAGRSFGRTLLWAVDGFPWCLPLVGFVVGLTTPGHRRVGDMAVKTFVVDKGHTGPVVVPGLTPSGHQPGGYPAPGGHPGAPGGPGQPWGAPGGWAPGPPGSAPQAPPPGWGAPAPAGPPTGGPAAPPTGAPGAGAPDQRPAPAGAAPSGAPGQGTTAPDQRPAPPGAPSPADAAEGAGGAAPSPPSTEPGGRQQAPPGVAPPGAPSGAGGGAAASPAASPAGEPVAAPSDTRPEGEAQPSTPPSEGEAGTPAGTGGPSMAPGGQAGPAPAGQPTQYNPQWDAARGTYIVWDPNRGRWLGWDERTREWKPL